MFNIEYHKDVNTIFLSGKFDGSKVNAANEVFNEINSTVTVDMKNLDYISSAGIGILTQTYVRLKKTNQEIILSNLNNHIREVFKISKLDTVFQIRS